MDESWGSRLGFRLGGGSVLGWLGLGLLLGLGLGLLQGGLGRGQLLALVLSAFAPRTEFVLATF